MEEIISYVWPLVCYFVGILIGRMSAQNEKKRQVIILIAPDIKVGEVYTMIIDRYVTVKVVEILGDTVYYNFLTSRGFIHNDPHASRLSKTSFLVCYHKP